MDLLWGTVLLRPYVFAFLAVYLIGASLQFGVRAALTFLPIGYLLAFSSEYASTHWGFPYGDYYYIPTTIDQELWVFGVPFMDSLSYVFLSACSYSTALFLCCPFEHPDAGKWGLRRAEPAWLPWLLGGLLMVFLDIVIDPVAYRGDRWFLGKIYGYPEPGHYFGIPISNFAGWFLVALVMIKVLQQLEKRWGKPPNSSLRQEMPAALWGPLLFLGVLVFNLAVTFCIGEYTLGLAGLFQIGLFVALGGTLILYKVRYPV
jgi:uncharacterized membrane protein